MRVRFTAEGVTADDVVLGMIADFPVDRPVIVVSSDREVADGVRRRADGVRQSVRAQSSPTVSCPGAGRATEALEVAVPSSSTQT